MCSSVFPHALLPGPSQQRKRATERQEIAREACERAEGEERPGDCAAQRNGLSRPLPVSQYRARTALPHPRGHQLLQLHHQAQTGHPRGHHELPECQEWVFLRREFLKIFYKNAFSRIQATFTSRTVWWASSRKWARNTALLSSESHADDSFSVFLWTRTSYPQTRPGPAHQAAVVSALRDLRGSVSFESRQGAPLLHCGHVRQRPPQAASPRARRADHVPPRSLRVRWEDARCCWSAEALVLRMQCSPVNKVLFPLRKLSAFSISIAGLVLAVILALVFLRVQQDIFIIANKKVIIWEDC